MGYFSKLADMGFMVVCRRNQLGTTTMLAVREDDYTIVGDFSDVLDDLPEWRVVDFVADDAAGATKLLYEKLTVTGSYADWDARMAATGLPEMVIGFEHRPQRERFQPVEA